MILKAQIVILQREDPSYPRAPLAPLGADAPPEICLAGPIALLNQPTVGLFCSSQCPGSIVLKSFDAVTKLRDEGTVLFGGFHSVMEWECLRILLRGSQPVIWAPARSILGMHLKSELVPPFQDGRLLILSPFPEQEKRITAALCEKRNRFIAALASRLFVPHAAPGGKTAALVRDLVGQGKEVSTIDDPFNQVLLSMGAIPLRNECAASHGAGRCTSATI